MSVGRTRAVRLVIANWRGFFYQEYELDPGVTAFEGANGAGKTTSMIAAYVVLLPDLQRLRFTNLGESGHTGGDRGLAGRLGFPGAPSYAVMDLVLADGERLLVGVRLERRGESGLEPTPFRISGLSASAALDELFLVRSEARDTIAEFDQIRDAVSRRGGEFKAFPTAREYFAFLYDQGVMPLRLAVEEERAKLNELLRASMVGGMSKALTGGMRDFLLPDDTTLGQQLAIVRENLASCRRTRTEVEDSRATESEVSDVLSVGQVAFAAGAHAMRIEAEVARETLERLETEAADLAQRLRELVVRHESEAARLIELRAESGRAQDASNAARDEADRARRAAQFAERIAQQQADVDQLSRLWEATRREQERSRQALFDQRELVAAAMEELKFASAAIADLRRGLEDEERRVAEHAMAIERRDRLGPLLDAPEYAALASRLEEEARAYMGQFDDVDLKLQRAATRAAQWAEARAWLSTMEARLALPEADVDHAERANTILAALAEQRTLAAALPDIARERDEARTLASRQAALRARVHGLVVEIGGIASAVDLKSANERLAKDAANNNQIRSAAESTSRAAADEQRERGRELQSLERRSDRRRDLRSFADALGSSRQALIMTGLELAAVRSAIDVDRDEARASRARTQLEAAALRKEASDLKSGGRLPPELLAASATLGAEPLAAMFEDVPLAEAAHVEAALGPLGRALVVSDVAAAAATFVAVESELAELHLVSSTTEIRVPTSLPIADGWVLIESAEGARLSRLPTSPTLGRRAREVRLSQVDEALTRAEAGLGECDKRIMRADTDRRTCDVLAAELDVLEDDAVDARLSVCKDALALARERKQVADSEAVAAGERERRARDLGARVVQLLPDAFLLDAIDYAQRLIELESRHTRAREAASRLTAIDPSAVARTHHAARAEAPFSDQEIAALEVRRDESEASARRTRALALDAGWLARHHEALGWSESAAHLAKRHALGPALEARRVEAERRHAVGTQLEARALVRDDEAAKQANAAHQNRSLAEATLTALREQLAETRIADPSHANARATETRAGEAKRHWEATEEQARKLAQTHAAQAQDLGELRHRSERHDRDVEARRAETLPLEARWQRFATQARSDGVMGAIWTPAVMRKFATSVDQSDHGGLWSTMREQGSVLRERARRVRDGQRLAERVDRWLDGDLERDDAALLGCWLEVRDWLLRRVPPHIADTADPTSALERLRADLSRLLERLDEHEKSFHHSSEGLSNKIGVLVREAEKKVRGLNHDLAGVSFGNIAKVRIRTEKVTAMMQLLAALREADAQRSLFDTDVSLEFALEQIVKRRGGTVRGDRVLDYREYLQLTVEVERRGHEDRWEPANANRVSTGEAIGVGAAVMIAVLKAWEQQAPAIRGRAPRGTLRMLFLDEATRLSSDNLGTLFDLCRRLELQLLVAAPAVDRAGGNTTYHLVRGRGADGQEEVVASGRRVRTP